MAIKHNPFQPSPYGPAPPGKPGPSGSGKLGANQGLLTSTGGLYGINGVLLVPVFNTGTNKSYIMLYDPTNFNCEENAEYDYTQIIPGNPPQEGRSVTCHLIILKYRELGIASFNVNVTTFIRDTDSFNTISIPVKIPFIPLTTKQRKQNFPDNRIHTARLYPPNNQYITGERPQVTITYNANSGPVSITSLTLCGNADEEVQA